MEVVNKGPVMDGVYFLVFNFFKLSLLVVSHSPKVLLTCPFWERLFSLVLLSELVFN